MIVPHTLGMLTANITCTYCIILLEYVNESVVWLGYKIFENQSFSRECLSEVSLGQDTFSVSHVKEGWGVILLPLSVCVCVCVAAAGA